MIVFVHLGVDAGMTFIIAFIAVRIRRLVLGGDDNMLLMSRIRQKASGYCPGAALTWAVSLPGGAICAAGLIVGAAVPERSHPQISLTARHRLVTIHSALICPADALHVYSALFRPVPRGGGPRAGR